MTDTFSTPRCTISGAALNRADGFRSIFTAIMRAVHPHMHSDAYFSDVLYDASTVDALNEGDVIYLQVRPTGTCMFMDGVEAIRSMAGCGATVVMRIVMRRHHTPQIYVIYDHNGLRIDNLI